MKRKIKRFMLVLASVLALGAVSSSGAFAAQFHSSLYPVSVWGTQTTKHVFTTNAGTVTCTKVPSGGTNETPTTNWIVLVEWDYENCTAFGFISVPIDMNACLYSMSSAGISEIFCNKGLEITAPFCTTTISPQWISSGNSFSNNASKTDFTLKTNISGLKYNECGVVRSNGTYTGTTTFSTEGIGSVWYE